MDSVVLTREATLQQTRLLLGLTDGASVVAWADAHILALAQPPAALLDVAGTPPADLSALRFALAPLAVDPVDPATVDAILQEVARAVIDRQRSAADSVHVLRQIRRMLPLPASLDADLDALIDTLMLAEAGIGVSRADAEDAIVRWAHEQHAGHRR